MSFTVREFEERDAARAAEIMYESFKTFFKERWGEDKRGTAEEYKKFLRSETPGNLSVAFVAEEEGKVIGFLHVTASTACGLGVLHRIGVDPQVFSKGVGRAMVAEAEKLWRKLRMRKIYTCTSHINQRALAFYKSLGFEEEGLLKEHFMEGIDEIQLGKFYKYND